MPPTSLFVQPTRCGLIRFYRRIYGIAPASLCERRGGFQLSLSANALAMYVMVSFSSVIHLDTPAIFLKNVDKCA